MSESPLHFHTMSKEAYWMAFVAVALVLFTFETRIGSQSDDRKKMVWRKTERQHFLFPDAPYQGRTVLFWGRGENELCKGLGENFVLTDVKARQQGTRTVDRVLQEHID